MTVLRFKSGQSNDKVCVPSRELRRQGGKWKERRDKEGRREADKEEKELGECRRWLI